MRSARSRTDVCSKPCAQKQFIAASSTVVSSNSLGRAIGLLAPAARLCRYPNDRSTKILEHACQNGKAIVSARLAIWQDLAVSPLVDLSRLLVCPISLIAEGQATNSFASLRIVANGGMSYLTKRLIHNTRVQENVFLSVNNIPIDQIGSYGNRSVIVISGAASGKNDKRDSRCVIPYTGNGEAIIFKSPLFRVNFVVGCIDSDTIGAINYKGVCRWFMPGVAEWDRDSNGLGWRSTWYSAERCTNWTDPGPISSNQSHMRVVSSKLGYN